jgi:hypothetical protein
LDVSPSKVVSHNVDNIDQDASHDEEIATPVAMT